MQRRHWRRYARAFIGIYFDIARSFIELLCVCVFMFGCARFECVGYVCWLHVCIDEVIIYLFCCPHYIMFSYLFDWLVSRINQQLGAAISGVYAYLYLMLYMSGVRVCVCDNFY